MGQGLAHAWCFPLKRPSSSSPLLPPTTTVAANPEQYATPLVITRGTHVRDAAPTATYLTANYWKMRFKSPLFRELFTSPTPSTIPSFFCPWMHNRLGFTSTWHLGRRVHDVHVLLIFRSNVTLSQWNRSYGRLLHDCTTSEPFILFSKFEGTFFFRWM